MKKLFYIFFLGTIFSIQASAQVLPPQFLCVKGDTLFWELPTNNCGPFNSYDIYASQNPTGPFTLLVSVTNQNQTAYFHPNPGGDTWYYYLLSNFDCPGQIAVPSDTLDNRPPEVSPIRSVSVEGGDVLVTWQPSPSPEVFAYVIYRETPIGVVPIDTVFGGNTYLDQGANADLQSESYFVNALDQCGNTSIFEVKHSTVLLEGSLSPCEQTVSLAWNRYLSWDNGIGEQEVWVGVNGAAPVFFETIDPAAEAYVFQNANDGDMYCFFIRALEQGSGEESKSNQFCVAAEVVQPVRDFFIKNVSVLSAGEVEVTWGWNASAQIKEVDVLRFNQNSGYNSVFSESPTLPLLSEKTYNDNTADPSAGKVFYKIQTVDNCDSVAFSTYGATVHLMGEAQPGNINLLTWTDLDIENAVSTSFDLYRIFNGAETIIATLTGPSSSHSDPFDPGSQGGTGACYYVIATGDLTTPTGETVTVRSRSNTVCLEQPLQVFVPNAFAPEGFNQEFIPVISPPDIARYEMRIFNRYGQELFQSNSPTSGWNGKKGTQKMPQGVYVYQILVTQPSGKVTEKRGSVLLLR